MIRVETRARSVAALAQAPSSWRVLNLLRANADSEEPPAVRVFASDTLNRAIFVRHNLRASEVDLFEDRRLVATKIVLPIDRKNFALGARTFFVGERLFEAHLRVLLSGAGERARITEELKRLALIDRMPTLDAFLIRERLHDAGYRVVLGSRWFDAALTGDAESFLVEELRPLVTLAVERSLTDKEIDRFVGAVLFEPGSKESAMIAAALGVEAPAWPELLFAWKAAIYYAWTTRSLAERFAGFQASLSRIEIYGGDPEARVEAQRARRALAAEALRLRAAVDGFLTRFRAGYRDALIQRRDPRTFRTALATLGREMMPFGEAYAQLEHILSYWDHMVVRRELTTLPADYFMTITGAIGITAAAASPGPASGDAASLAAALRDAMAKPA